MPIFGNITLSLQYIGAMHIIIMMFIDMIIRLATMAFSSSSSIYSNHHCGHHHLHGDHVHHGLHHSEKILIRLVLPYARQILAGNGGPLLMACPQPDDVIYIPPFYFLFEKITTAFTFTLKI